MNYLQKRLFYLSASRLNHPMENLIVDWRMTMKSLRLRMFHLILFCMVLIAIPCFVLLSSPAQEDALQQLNNSPRHHEWVKVKQGEREVSSFIVFPESSGKTPAVIIIHENRGLIDWVRSVADRIAEAGCIAIAPDFLSGMGPNGGKTSDFLDTNAARDALYQIPAGQVTADLQAVADYVKKLDACNGKLAVAGFCWGGQQTFDFVTKRSDLSAAFVFYGTPPGDPDAFARIPCPVYGFYGGNDARVTSTIPKADEMMKAAKKLYESVVYEGAGHGFMRSGEEPGARDANREAKNTAWKRWLELLKKI